MDFKHFDVDANLRETTTHGDALFPIAVYLQKVNETLQGFVIPHWHEEFQFILQQYGTTIYQVNDKQYTVPLGYGLFINSRQLHSARALNGNSRYICVDINPAAVSGAANSLVQQKYIQPLMRSNQAEAILLEPSVAWHKQVMDSILSLISEYERPSYGYELRVKSALFMAFNYLIINQDHKLDAIPNRLPALKNRMTLMTKYIEQHYTEDITLRDLSLCANVSEGECCRCFKKMTNLSPIAYLLQFRIAKSIALLVSTEMSILDVALKCGFTSNSYFTMRFRKIMGCTPLEYRNGHLEMSRVEQASTKVFFPIE